MQLERILILVLIGAAACSSGSGGGSGGTGGIGDTGGIGGPGGGVGSGSGGLGGAGGSTGGSAAGGGGSGVTTGAGGSPTGGTAGAGTGGAAGTSGTACNVVYNCPAGESCLASGATFSCMPDGTGKAGDSCDATAGSPITCGDQLLCAASTTPTAGTCVLWCDSTHPCPTGKGCQEVHTSQGATLNLCILNT